LWIVFLMAAVARLPRFQFDRCLQIDHRISSFASATTKKKVVSNGYHSRTRRVSAMLAPRPDSGFSANLTLVTGTVGEPRRAIAVLRELILLTTLARKQD
jgi:hypothetical protein